MNIESISRRSFLKKTTVLTVGVASLTLFSGLVNGADEHQPYVNDEGQCAFFESGEFSGSCGYSDQLTTYKFSCGQDIYCCYDQLMCNGKESIGMTSTCPKEDGPVRDRCMEHETKSPPVLPYCQPLG